MASGTESATETSYWIKFFTEAQIPAGDAAHYAVLFSDNRIQRGMLLDLTKEYLTDMGITRLGDVIAILKHAKSVHSQDAKDKVLKGAKFISPAASATASPVRRSTAASRMVGHHLTKTPDSAPMNQPPPPKPQVNTSSSGKTSVFDRLGSDSPGNSPKVGSGADSVFSRLGGKTGQKRPASSSSPADSDDEGTPKSPLEYQGILKYPTATKKSPPVVPRKKVRVTVDDSVKVTGLDKFKVTGLDSFKVVGLDRVRVNPKASNFDVSDIQSLKVQVSSTTATPKTKPKRRTTMPATSSLDDMLASAKLLSIQKEEVTTTTKPALRTQGVLSMDAPEPANVKTRLGPKVQTAPASSTTSGFGPSTKKASVTASDVKSRLGMKSAQQTAQTSKQKVTTSGDAQSKATSASGVFSRLGKKTAVS